MGSDAISSPQVQQAIRCLAAVREAVGDEADVLTDIHGHFDADGALALREAVAPLRLYWMEDACPGPVRRTMVAGTWVAFFQVCQQQSCE